MDEVEAKFIGAIIGIILVSIILICVYSAKSSKASNMKQSYHELRIGMTKDEVLDMLGSPNTVGMKDSNTEVLQWRNDEGILRSAFDKDTARVIRVEIQAGKVTAFDGINIDKRTW